MTIIRIDRIKFSSKICGLTLIATLTWALISALIKLLQSHYSQIKKKEARTKVDRQTKMTNIPENRNVRHLLYMIREFEDSWGSARV